MAFTTKFDNNPTHHLVLVNPTCYGDRHSKWVEPRSRFSKPVKSGCGGGGGVTVVDSKSCRQLYLRSAYTFTREDELNNNNNNKKVKERAKKCLGRAQHRVVTLLLCNSNKKSGVIDNNDGKRDDQNKTSMMVLRMANHLSSASHLMSVLIRRILACTVKAPNSTATHPPSEFPPLPWNFL